MVNGIENTPEYMFGKINAQLSELKTQTNRIEAKLDETCRNHNDRLQSLETWKSSVKAQAGVLGLIGGIIASGIVLAAKFFSRQ